MKKFAECEPIEKCLLSEFFKNKWIGLLLNLKFYYNKQFEF